MECRDELYGSGMHKAKYADIWGTMEYGAYSIVFKGMHAEDEDHGENMWVRNSHHRMLIYPVSRVFTGSGI
jgi:hypothetical protein